MDPESPSRGLYRASKRAIDVLLAAGGLLVAVPLGLVFAVAIKLEDGGPVFYAQERVGKGGSHFSIRKFRTMVADADERYGLLQASVEDPRVTRVGAFLRATAMDELPQLWNILRGEMSFVGPRALCPEEVELEGGGERLAMADIPGCEERHRVRPGLTGLAQIFQPRDVPRRNKFRVDLLYIRKRGLLLDLGLLCWSFLRTLRGGWGTKRPRTRRLRLGKVDGVTTPTIGA